MNNLNKLVDLIFSLKSKQELKDLLSGILTPAELEVIPKRLQIFKLLKQGIPQRQIAKKLNVSIATITRGSRELRYGKSKNLSSTIWRAEKLTS